MFRPLLIFIFLSLASTSLCAQLTTTEEKVEDGTLTTYFRNGIKILTDEVIFVGENTPQRRIQTQIVWMGEVSIMRIDTFMIDPMRYYYFKDGISMTEVIDPKEIYITRDRWPEEEDIRDAFHVGEDGMLTPFSNEKWKQTCVPKKGVLRKGETTQIGPIKITLGKENKTVEETDNTTKIRTINVS